MISSRAKRACSLLTARGLSQLQNSMQSTNDVMEYFAFPGNIDFAADDQGAFSCIIYERVSCLLIVFATIGVMNGPLKFLTARKILPLLDLLAKFERVLACSCAPKFCSCSHARFLVSIARNFVTASLG